MTRRVALALLWAAAVQGQELGRIEGRVVSPTGEPVRKATVRLIGAESGVYIETTGTDGSFVFAGLPAGRYQASAEKTGFEAGRTQGTVALASGQTLRDFQLAMAPLAVISGRVLDADGDPIPHAHVTLLSQRWDFRGRTLQLTNSTTADDRGVFRLVNLKPGRYYARAEGTGSVAGSFVSPHLGPNAQLEQLETYYPSESDARRAQSIEVKPGQEAQGIDIRMRRGRLYSIRGRAVHALTNAPLPGALLAWREGSSVPSANARVPADSFHIRLPEGEFVLEFVSTDLDSRQQAVSEPLRVTVSGDIEGLALRAAPNMHFSGRIVIDEGDFEKVREAARTTLPVAGRNSIELIAGMPALSVSLVATGRTPRTRSGLIERDGSFGIDNIELGKYALFIPNLPGTYFKTVRVGGRDVPANAPLDLSTGDPGLVEIVLAQGPASVAVAGSRAVGQTAVLWPKEPNALLQFGGIVTMGASAQPVAPGDYYLATFVDADPEALRSYAFLRMFNDAAAEVSLKAGEQVSAETKFVSRDVIDAALANLP